MAAKPYFCKYRSVRKTRFEWDEAKDRANQSKHGLAFFEAQFAFADPQRVIARDLGHSKEEQRSCCFGSPGEGIVTVRFTCRNEVI